MGKIFCDIDGVLMNFAEAYISRFKDSVWTHSGGITSWEFYEELGQTKEEFHQNVDSLDYSFWAEMPTLYWTADLVKALRASFHDVSLLSHSVGLASDMGKCRAMDKIGLKQDVYDRHFVRDTADKIDFCTGPDCLLIDDRIANCEAWREAGGTAMLLSTAYNFRGGWDGGKMYCGLRVTERYSFEQQILDVFGRNLSPNSCVRDLCTSIECTEEGPCPEQDLLSALFRQPGDEAKSRKETPVFSGFLKYFPKAVQEVARLSRVGNDQHNPGTELHWDRSKSGDELDALSRHLLDCGTEDKDGVLHDVKVAWRAMANLEKVLEGRDAS